MPIKGFELNNTVDAKVKVCATITNQSQMSIMNVAIEEYCDNIIAENQEFILKMFNITPKKK